MDYKERLAWLATLQPGAEVLVVGRGEAIGSVARRSPSGRLIVTVGVREMTFNPDGNERGGDPLWRADLRPLTPEARDKIEARRLAEKLARINFHKLPIGQLRDVAQLLGLED